MPSLEERKSQFIADIIANPGDDDLRLIYADWLEDQGEPERAEFIRVQCELAKPECCAGAGDGRHCASDCRDLEFRSREARLILGYPGWFEWSGAARLFVPKDTHFAEVLTFRRGFVEALTCTAADWLQHADAATAQQPIREVVLTTELSWLIEMSSIILFEDGSLNNPSRWRWCQQATIDDLLSHKAPTHLRLILATEWPGITFKAPQ